MFLRYLRSSAPPAMRFEPTIILPGSRTTTLLSEQEHRRLVSLRTSWLIEADQAIVGFLCAERMMSRALSELHVWELAVHADVQGRGLGKALLRSVMASASADVTCDSVTLTTFRHIPFNAPFYARLGFERVDDLTDEKRLERILAAEAAHGLPTEHRCAMRWMA